MADAKRWPSEVQKHRRARKGDWWKNTLVYMLFFGLCLAVLLTCVLYTPSRTKNVACEVYGICLQGRGL